MLDRQYLLHGLDALCRAHESDYFADGHRGGAIVSAFYLCKETEIDAGAQELLRQADRIVRGGRLLCGGFGWCPPDP